MEIPVCMPETPQPTADAPSKRINFFVSRTGADSAWAQWIAWQLERKGYSVVIQDWDFGPGVNFIHKMQQASTEAECTIAVLSQRYFQSPYTEAEWTAAFYRDPSGEKGFLLPIRIENFPLPGMFGARTYIDLVDVDEDTARQRLLAWFERVHTPRGGKPDQEPIFPGSPKTQEPASAAKPEPNFPGRLPPIFGLPARNRNFTGREALLEQLRNQLADGRAAVLTAATRQVATYGLGGTGKSQLAIEYAWRWASDCSRVIWLRAETPETLAADFDALANDLGLFKSNKPAEQAAVIEAVRKHLTENRGWLLIFDNAPEPRAVECAVPRAGGQVIYTSRYTAWGKHAVPLRVDILPPEEAEQFLLQRVGAKREEQDAPERRAAAELAQELGCLPLALEQAAAYCEQSSITLADYLPLFQERRLELFSPETLGGDQDGNEMITVTTTWNLSLDRIRDNENRPEAAALFTLCAFFGPDRIPLEMVRAGADHLPAPLSAAALDNLKVNAALAALLRYSLVAVEGSGNERVLSVHRLLQEVTRERLPEDEKGRWITAALQIVNQAFPDSGFDMRAWPTCGQLAPHAVAVLHYADAIWGKAAGPGHRDTLTTRGHIAHWTGQTGQAREAVRLAQGLLPDRERVLGPDHPDTLATRSNIAHWTGQTGQAREALRLFRELLPDQERVLGPDHPNVLETRSNIALWTGRTGEAREALRLSRELLPDQERVLGPDHPDTLTTRSLIASWTGEMGEAREALRLLEELLPDAERLLGPDHSDTLITRSSIAHWTGETGRAREALRLFRELLPDRERALGPDHPDTLTTRNNITAWTGETGQAREALRLFRELLPDRERVLGPDHPGTLTTRGHIAHWTGQTGQTREALRLFQELLPDWERVLGPDHPDTLTTRGHIAHWTGETGQAHEALRLFQELLPDRERVLGPDHPDTLRTRSNIAHWTGQTGQAREALRLFRELLPDQERVLGPDHPNVLETRSNIALWTGRTGEAREALRLSRELLPDQERVLGPDHPDTLATRKSIASWTREEA